MSNNEICSYCGDCEEPVDDDKLCRYCAVYHNQTVSTKEEDVRYA